MNIESRLCQNCKATFTIEPDDFGFYEKIKVPPPTFCPECRYIRRLLDRNEYNLYKRKCDATGRMVISIYRPDAPFPVYNQEYWKSDAFDAMKYGRDFDFNRLFFEQYEELRHIVPHLAMVNSNSVNSEYTNQSDNNKDCYMIFTSTGIEKCMYGSWCQQSCYFLSDCYMAQQSEFCYECVNITKCSQCAWVYDCSDCVNVYFSRDLVNCNNCFGCTSLRNKSNCIFNEQLTKEEYNKRIKELDLGSMINLQKLKEKAYKLSLKYPRRAIRGVNNVNFSGEYVYNSKNAHNVYYVSDAENIKYAQLFITGGTNNCYDFTAFGTTSEWVYEATWTGYNTSNVKFSVWNYRNHDTEYTFGCHSSAYLFGCVGLRKAEYCIFNKQHSKEEYFQLVEKIKKQMNEMPFIDRRGLEHRYGTQIPIDLCPWTYNETAVHEFFPLSKEEALAKGFTWRDPDHREYLDATIVVPDHIKDVTDDILKAILKCEACGKNYQIIQKELVFLRRFNLLIPNYCPLCRDRARIKQLNPMQTYNRKCDKCNIAIETSYAPNRPEIVYCEKCYQQEVY